MHVPLKLSSPLQTLSSRREEESRIVARWLGRLRECLRPYGPALFAAALEDAGISEEAAANAQDLTLDQLDRALGSARRKVPEITLRVMASLSALDLGLVGYAAVSAERIGKALEILLTYHELTSDRYDQALELDGSEACVRIVPKPAYMHEMRDIGEDALVGTWRFLEATLGPEARAEFGRASARFDHAPPAYADVYREVLGCACVFEADRTELRFPSAWLDRPVATANPAVADLCRATCERVLGPPQPRSDARQDVARLLLSAPGRRMMSLEDAATHMLRSPSRLRKQLYRAGTTYKRVVLEVRMALARHYLEASNLSVETIAYLLDYSEPPAFSRAFRREVGMAPQLYRRSLARRGEVAPPN